jgi:hypothetical protein
VDVERVVTALHEVETGELSSAAASLRPLVRSRRLVRASGSASVPEEITEIEGWLRQVIAMPGSTDASSLVTRAYYKLCSQMPGEDPRRR